ncbi:hypothetical protein pb186bvf_004089 [Paramecium bursaria]
MGVCASKKTTKTSQNKNSQIIKDMAQMEEQANRKSTILGHMWQINRDLEPKEYDPNNPHRQQNVWINGVLFAVINSPEPSIQE